MLLTSLVADIHVTSPGHIQTIFRVPTSGTSSPGEQAEQENEPSSHNEKTVRETKPQVVLTPHNTNRSLLIEGAVVGLRGSANQS